MNIFHYAEFFESGGTLKMEGMPLPAFISVEGMRGKRFSSYFSYQKKGGLIDKPTQLLVRAVVQALAPVPEEG